MKFLKILVIYTFLFLLFYFEPEKIGPITFSQLWKIPFFLFLFWQILVIRRLNKPTFVKLSYLRASKNLITAGFVSGFIAQITDFLRYMMFPLMFEFIKLKIKKPASINQLLLHYSFFVILSGIPFVLGILETKGHALFELDYFESYAGIFQGAHAASITTTSAVLILMYFFKEKKIKGIANLLLILFGVYLIYLTYVRTGYAMFAIGIFIIFLPKRLTTKQIIGGGLVLTLFIIGFFYLLNNNEMFYNRIFDIRNGQETDVGSGRLLFWMSSVNLWLGGTPFEMLFGFGYNGLTEHMYQTLGLRVYAHNELFTQLGQNGLLGVILFFAFLVSLFRFIRAHKNCPSYRLALTMFFLYLSLMTTQGGMWFQLDIYLALVFSKLALESVPVGNKVAEANGLDKRRYGKYAYKLKS